MQGHKSPYRLTPMTTLADRLKQARKDAKLTQRELAKAAGIKQPVISQIESGANLQSAHIAKLAHICGVEALWLAEGKGPKHISAPGSSEGKESNVQAVDFSRRRLRSDEMSIPQFDVRASMGHGQVVPDSYIETIRNITVRADYLREQGVFYTHQDNLAVVTGFGESMEKTYRSGDPLIIDRGVNSVVVDGVYLFTLDGMLYIKRLQRLPRMIKMISDNESFEPYDIKGDELDSLIIHARVLMAWNAKKL